MALEFKAEMIDGKLHVKPIIERKGNDVTIHLPSLPLISEVKKEHGKRNL